MKTIKTLFALSLFTLIIACGHSKNMNGSINMSNTRNNTDVNRSKSETTFDNQTTDRYDLELNQKDQDIKGNDQKPEKLINNQRENKQSMNHSNWEDPKMLQRRQKLYADLMMTPDQIKRYESEYRNGMDKWNKENGSRKMSISELEKHNDGLLNSILIPSQYTQYQTWLKSNPYEY